MNKRIYINDFVEDLNYTKIILHVDDSIDLAVLRERLNKDNTNHLYRMDYIKNNRLFYIENCDFQNIDDESPFTDDAEYDELREMLSDGYSVFQLYSDEVGYYITLPYFITEQFKERR